MSITANSNNNMTQKEALKRDIQCLDRLATELSFVERDVDTRNIALLEQFEIARKLIFALKLQIENQLNE